MKIELDEEMKLLLAFLAGLTCPYSLVGIGLFFGFKYLLEKSDKKEDGK